MNNKFKLLIAFCIIIIFSTCVGFFVTYVERQKYNNYTPYNGTIIETKIERISTKSIFRQLSCKFEIETDNKTIAKFAFIKKSYYKHKLKKLKDTTFAIGTTHIVYNKNNDIVYDKTNKPMIVGGTVGLVIGAVLFVIVPFGIFRHKTRDPLI